MYPKYEEDFYGWAIANASLLKKGSFNEADMNHIIEELESMGRSEKRELVNRLAVLISHLLKWKLQPGLRGNSWKYTIKEQRIRICDLLEDSPSLNHEIEAKLNHAYEQAILITVRDTGIEENNLPNQCPFTFTQCLDSQFFPID